MPKCVQRCLGTLLSEPSCVFNLLTHFHGACSTELGAGSPLDPLCYSPAAATLLGPLWTNNALHFPSPPPPNASSFFCLLFCHLSVSIHHPWPLSSICSADADFENVFFQGRCQRTSITRRVVAMKYGENGDRKWKVREELHVRVRCLGSFQGKTEVRAADVWLQQWLFVWKFDASIQICEHAKETKCVLVSPSLTSSCSNISNTGLESMDTGSTFILYWGYWSAGICWKQLRLDVTCQSERRLIFLMLQSRTPEWPES